MSYPLEYGDSPDTAAFNALNPPRTFRDLVVGQTFDFVDDARPGYNSFFARCTKTSARKYTWFVRDWQAGGDALQTLSSSVGSIDAKVFHVH